MQATASSPSSATPARRAKPLPGHRAAQRIRAWRMAQEPRLSAEEFGLRYGVSMPQVYRFEAGTRMAPVALALQLERDGVCAVTDWATPAVPDEDAACADSGK